VTPLRPNSNAARQLAAVVAAEAKGKSKLAPRGGKKETEVSEVPPPAASAAQQVA